jgi:hypothetical protein
MKKKFLFLNNVFFIFLVSFFLVNHSVIAQHACNQSCTGAADITCNETTGNLSYNRGSCNTGLACYSGAGNRCRNPYCPNRTDCACPNFTIQSFILPNQAPYSSQGVYLNGQTSTTAQPYFFYNVPANSIHRVNVGVPAGSTVGYTLCYDKTDCHSNSPTPGSQVYICSNKLTSYADLYWHYVTPTPTRTPTPTPTLYPTVVITGVLREKSYNSCSTGVLGALLVNVIPQNSQGITTSCGITPAAAPYSSYRCTLTFNNQTANPTPAQNVTLNVSTSSYGTAYWANSCTTSSLPNLSFNVASSPPINILNKDIFFETSPWPKFKDVSLATGTINYQIPNTISPFDSEDNTNRYLVINQAGVITAQSINTPSTQLSQTQWNKTSYSANKPLINLFFDYVKSRKSYTQISSFSDINKDGVYFLNSGLSISDADNIPQYNFVLIVGGNVIISKNNFNLIGANDALAKPITIIAPNNNITFSSSVQKAGGIFVANSVSYNSTTGLKIKGNLVSLGPVSLQARSDSNDKPSLFVVFDPTAYLGLLDKLSIAKYDWKQLQ